MTEFINREPTIEFYEYILLLIDRVGDRSLINQLGNTHQYTNYTPENSNNEDISSFINTDYIINSEDDFIYLPSWDENSNIHSRFTSLQISILDEAIEFTKEQCDCCICLDTHDSNDTCQFNCGHTCCVSCTSTSINSFRIRQQRVNCSLCRVNIDTISVKTQQNKDKIQLCI